MTILLILFFILYSIACLEHFISMEWNLQNFIMTFPLGAALIVTLIAILKIILQGDANAW